MERQHVERRRHLDSLARLLARFPVVGLLGARQVGKTTLARDFAARRDAPAAFFDLEDPADLARLAEPMVALRPTRGLVVIDEVQRRPDLFPALRVLADAGVRRLLVREPSLEELFLAHYGPDSKSSEAAGVA